ncbi:MAG: hypothetical protein ACTSYI_07840 [Promethearchaeota archaeon]
MSLPNKDNLTNATSTSQIDWYFDLQNPAAKKRHIVFFSVEIFNVIILLLSFFLYFENIILILWIGIIVVLILITILLIWRKHSYYRLIIYLLAFGGSINCLLLWHRYIVLIIPAIVTSIFLIHFVSIEVSLQRHMNYFVRVAKMKNFTRFGRDNFEEK